MKPSIPKGTRDYTPEQVARRDYIFGSIRQVFEKYGYQPIETPVMENLSTLLGKYGEEGDKLLFKVLNNGDFLSKADKEALESLDSQKLVPSISRKGLRYDLTVPFARYVVMHQHEIQFPFKRYQIQPVWRADRPQKGRYQEFYQCDADAVGSTSLMLEAEYVTMIDEVFSKLNLEVDIKINNRKILAGMAEKVGLGEKLVPMTVAVDKLDKIGWGGVIKELEKYDIAEPQVQQLKLILEAQDLQTLGEALADSDEGRQGVTELQEVFSYLEGIDLKQKVTFDPALARGLSYYTGCILEVKSLEAEMGSILGGGRYDNLTGVFGLKGVSGVGISFGIARIYDVLEELNRFPAQVDKQEGVMLMAMNSECHKWAFKLVRRLRNAGIGAHLYPDPVKLKKQMKHANGIGVSHVIIVGEDEMVSGIYTLKDMDSGLQNTYSEAELIAQLK